MPRPEGAAQLPLRLVRRVRDLTPTGGGLVDEDWNGRHSLLTRTMIGSALLVSAVGLFRDRLDEQWLVSIALILICTLGAIFLPPRRLPSAAVAIGLTAVCADLVMMFDGLTEAHFSFFIAVGALALYRDWVPFIIFLGGTVAHHAVAGALMAHRTYDHMGAYHHPWFWALIHGVAVLMAALTQVIAWRLSEVEEKRASEDLTQAEAQFTAAFEEAPVPMSMMSPEGLVLRVNPAFERWLGLTEPLPAGTTIATLPIQPVDPDNPPRLFARLNAGADVIREEHTFRHANGTVVKVDLHVSALRDSAGRLKVVVSHFMDVTEKRASEDLLHQKVREDSLTGLLSRAAFEGDLAALIEARTDTVSVIYIDVDRFKAVNDSHGHGAGDEVLHVLGARLAAVAPADALVARLGGDEFAIALPGDVSRGEQLGRAIIDSCAEPFVVSGGQLQLTVSLGISGGAPGERAEATLQSADLAMYAAKQGGRDRIRLFDDTMRLNSQRRVVAEQLLRSALDSDRVVGLPVWFQPIVSLGTRRIIGAEALVRLRGPDGKLVSPADFIPIAEETGLVVPLGQHVLRTALSHLSEWGDKLPYVSVNVSPRQLSEADFVPMLADELAASGLTEPSRLVLEITETSILQSSVDLDHRLNAIKKLGVRLALDDFGTGYSSLTWLQSVPADIVKLDRSFVAGLANDPAKSSIIYAVLWLAKALNMQVIAEGVEEIEDAEKLAAAECPAAQGYLFSRPVEPEALTKLLAAKPAAWIPTQRKPSASETPAGGELSRTPPRIVNVP